MSKDYFDKIANNWDNLQASFFSSCVRDRAFTFANLKPKCIAADIGSGTGFITEGLINKGLKVIAVDQSKAMLDQMRTKFKNESDIDYRLTSSTKLPIENNSVDYVFANMYLHHVESPFDAIMEMMRILKHGGKMIITDLDEHKFEFLRTEQHDKWLGFKKAIIKKWFYDINLQNIFVDCIGENCCAESDSGDELASVSIFIAYGEKGINPSI
ncbi:MAG: class I SAM-dependent methyltransferase [Spirochaetota bacterium]|nr:class I SAM-dependent methyltransferase [Spirochaetota bacterium]